MENPIKMDDLGYPYFWKHPYWFPLKAFSSTISFIPSSSPGSQDQLRKEQLVQAPPGVSGAEDPMFFQKVIDSVPQKIQKIGSQNLPELHVNKTRWCFQIYFYVHPYYLGDDPIWLIFFRWVETTN